MKLEGQVIWVTGASSGIGRTTVEEMLRRGATVYGTARSEDALEELAARSQRFHAAPGDVTSLDLMREIAEEIHAEHGRIDMAFFNAGVWKQVSVRDFSSEAFRTTFEVNLMGTVHGIEAVLPAMIERRAGAIVGVASVAGYRGLPNAAAYSAAKGATINLLESLRIDAGKYGIRVVTVNPGFVDTPMTERNEFPMPFMVSAEHAATTICDGLERSQNEIVFPLPMAIATKAMRLLPVSLHAAAFRRAGRR